MPTQTASKRINADGVKTAIVTGRKNNDELRVNDRNGFLFCGTIVNNYASKNITLVTLGVTTQDGFRTKSNYPRICFFSEELRNKAAEFELHDKVVIEGYITSPKRVPSDRRPLDKKAGTQTSDLPMQSFVATDIREARSLMAAEFGIQDGSGAKVPDQNKVNLIGTVSQAYFGKGGNINITLVSFRENRYMKRIMITYFPKRDENVLSCMAPGTRICVSGYCRTTRKELPDGTIKYYESIIANAIAKETLTTE